MICEDTFFAHVGFVSPSTVVPGSAVNATPTLTAHPMFSSSVPVTGSHFLIQHLTNHHIQMAGYTVSLKGKAISGHICAPLGIPRHLDCTSAGLDAKADCSF